MLIAPFDYRVSRRFWGIDDYLKPALDHLEHASFEEWWEPFTGGVGPASSYIASLDAGRHADLRERCRSMLPVAPFALKARAWAARGLA